MKRLIISVAGTDGKQEKDVALAPGTKVRDVLTQLKLTGFQLTNPEGGNYAPGDDLYTAVQDGQKIFATKAAVEAG